MLRIYRILQYFSIDVAAGVWFSGNMVAHLTHTTMPLLWQFILPLSTIFVYNLDHQLDAAQIGDQVISERHRFHVRHRRKIRAGLGMLLLVCATGFFLPTPIVLTGAGIATFTLLHLGLVSLAGDRASILMIKEVGVGIIYPAGIWLPVFALRGTWPSPAEWLAFALFFALVLMSLIIFSCYDEAIDRQQHQTSIVQGWGLKASVRLTALLGAGIFAGVVCLSPHFPQLAALYAGMNAIQCWLLLDRRRFAPRGWYRIIGELVFSLPGLLLLG